MGRHDEREREESGIDCVLREREESGVDCMAAGAFGVLVTVFSVDDTATKLVMAALYCHLCCCS